MFRYTTRPTQRYFYTMSTSSTMPVRPSKVMAAFGVELQAMIADEMLAMQEETQSADDMRDSLFRMTRNVIKNTGKIQFAVRTGGHGPTVDALVEENTRIINELLISAGGEPSQRSGQLSQAITTFTETRMMQHFFSTGALAAPSLLQPCDDDEYMGAALGFSQELARYAKRRAKKAQPCTMMFYKTECCWSCWRRSCLRWQGQGQG